MTRNRFLDFHCVCTIIQVVHTEFIKDVLTEYSAFKSLSKMIQEQLAAAVIIALIFEKSKSRKKGKKVCVRPWLKRRKKIMNLCLQNFGYKMNIIIKFYLQITSGNFEEIFQLIKDDINKENTKMKELNPAQTITCSNNWLLINRGIIQELCL